MRAVTRQPPSGSGPTASDPPHASTLSRRPMGRVLGKLGLRDRVQAVVLAYESGLTGR